MFLFLLSATKLRRLCFYRHLSVHRPVGVSVSVHAGIPHPLEADTPWEQTPPQNRHPLKQTPLEQTPLGADTSPRADTPLEQTPPKADTHPPEQTPPGADTPLGVDPLEQTPPQEQTPLEQTPTGADTPPADTPPRADTPCSRHPPGADTPRSRHPPEIWSLLWMVRILLECILVFCNFSWFTLRSLAFVRDTIVSELGKCSVDTLQCLKL